MSFLEKFSLVGAVLGVSMMVASPASAITVHADGAPGSGIEDGTEGDGNVGNGTVYTLNGDLTSYESTSDRLPENGNGTFYFEFVNTHATSNIIASASVGVNPTSPLPLVDNFTLTWLNAAFINIGSYVGLPAPNFFTLDTVIGIGQSFYLVATWDDVDTFGANDDTPFITFSVSSNVTDSRIPEVPLPPSLVLFGSGLLGLGFLSARRRRKGESI